MCMKKAVRVGPDNLDNTVSSLLALISREYVHLVWHTTQLYVHVYVRDSDSGNN